MFEIELEVGEVLMVGETVLTIVDIEEGDVTFKVSHTDGGADLLVSISEDALKENNSDASFSTIPR